MLFFIRIDVEGNDTPHYLKPHGDAYEVMPGIVGAAGFKHANALYMLSLIQAQFKGCENARMVDAQLEIKNSKEDLYRPELDNISNKNN